MHAYNPGIAYTCLLLESDVDIVKSIIKNVMKAHGTHLRQMLEPFHIQEFAQRMIQANLIADVVVKSVEYQMLINDFLSCLEYASTKQEVIKDCNKLLKILKDIGGPFTRASEVIKRDIIDDCYKCKCTVELY